ncbi:nuclear pore complex protein NUP88 isoform X5 [Magnolia sinica]|uniref:nuclear pore complex protein NUP88 isoform X5 n=1 Tax=Magnolia sinica TaxID=86752 RepID=UPI002659ADA7|nr:nuclear pore complex protein NUP88 isoform X5 [Magnolia sinica]
MEREKHISPSKEEAAAAEWLPLQQHPIFSSCSSSTPSSDCRLPFNLLAWDGASRLYLWDPNTRRLHRLSLRFPDLDPASIEASSVSKMLCPDIQIHFTIYNISVNRTGSSLLLSGPDGLCVMYLYGQTSIKDNAIICRTISVGSQVYFDSSNSMRTLQASWHPYSDTHLGILSSDSVFRLFDLSTDLERPEQEYYLQPVEPVRCCNAVSVCPVAFSFGGEHLWDRFSVFVVFSDGSIYVLCPIVPFGSFYSWTSIEEIYKDAHTFGQKSSNLQAVTSSSFAIAWLEATFPDFGNHEMEGGNLLALKARPYVPFDASLALQVYIELKHHGAYLKRILTNQHERLREANQKLLNVEEKQRSLDDRIHHAVQMYGFLEERLQRFRSLPGANQKPLSRAEREFKSQLEPPEDPSPLEAHVVELPQLHVSCLAEPVEGVVALGTAIDVSPQLSIPYPTGSEGGVPITEVPVEELLEPSAPLPTEDSKGEGAPDVSTEVPPSPTILVVSTEATEVGIALKVTEGPSTPTIRALVEEVNATAFAEEVLTAAPVVAMAPIYNARQLAMNFVRQIVTLISTKLAYPDNWSGLHVERDMLLSSAVWVGIDVGLVGNLLARFSDTMSRLEQTKAEAATVQAAREQRDRLLVLEAEIPRLMRVCDVTTNSAKAAEEDAAVQQEMLCVARRKIANLRELLMAAEAEEQATEARLADAKKLVETTRAIAWGEKDQLVELQREMLDLQENLANLPDYSQDIAQGEAEAGRLRGELSEALRDLM